MTRQRLRGCGSVGPFGMREIPAGPRRLDGRRRSLHGAGRRPADLAAGSGAGKIGPRSARWALGSESPRLANTTLSSAAATNARATIANDAAGRGLGRARPRSRRPRSQLREARPNVAGAGDGAAKIERLGSPAPSGAASADAGDGTSKMLRARPGELSEKKGIYLREARTSKNGPPAPASGAREERNASAQRPDRRTREALR